MTTPASNPDRQLDISLVNAQQTLAILRSQVQSGRIDVTYVDQRLQSLETLLGQLSEERKRSSQQQRFAKLFEVSRAIGSSLDLQTVLDQVMDSIIQLTGAERGFLMLFDDDGNLTIPVRRNFDQETIEQNAVAISRTITNRVLETNQAIITTNAQEDPRFAGQASVVAHALRSIMASPLRVRGNVIGVVYVDNRVRTGLFIEQDLDVLETFAGQAAVAIDNARLFRATDQALNARVEELTMLQRMDRELNETLDLNTAMRVTLEWSIRVCGAQSASLGLMDAESGKVHIVAHSGTADMFSASQEAEIDPHMPLLHGVMETQEAQLHQHDDHAVFVVPIRRSNRVIGVIVMSADSPNAFQEEDRALLTRMADRAAIAIENARLYAAVKAANNAKSEFVSMVAHELKVPMTSISGYADLITMAGSISEKQAGFLQTIKNAVYRMKVLVSDLNDISRIETGNLRVDLANVSVPEVIAAVREGILTEISERDHTLHIDVDPDLPPVRADRERLVQVLLNLASNAYKYTPNGGSIGIAARKDGSKIIFRVVDNGVGMTPEQVSKLGTKFWRADNGLGQPGTGLGFAITRNLIELMGGVLNIQSAVGKGTQISFALPVGG